jgi:hypothetical protein
MDSVIAMGHIAMGDPYKPVRTSNECLDLGELLKQANADQVYREKERLLEILAEQQMGATVDGLKVSPAPTPFNSGGTKHDQGKARMSLLDSSWLLGVAEVLTFGEKKYQAHNWRKGISVSRLMDAAGRHQAAFNDGEDLDPESGKGHLYHASCCLMFASWMIKHRPDLDDRCKGT